MVPMLLDKWDEFIVFVYSYVANKHGTIEKQQFQDINWRLLLFVLPFPLFIINYLLSILF